MPAARSQRSKSTRRTTGCKNPKNFAAWHDSTPADFVFSVKGSRYVTNRRKLGDGGEAVERFMASGLAELQGKLGPLVWQLPTTKAFDPDDVEAFLSLLPATLAGRAVRHALEVRHPSFMCESFLALARRHRVATVFADSNDYPSFDDPTGDFVYARLMKTESRYEAGYPPAKLDFWAQYARLWTAGQRPEGLPNIAKPALESGPKEVFIFFISGAKEKAPAAAMALIERLPQGQTGKLLRPSAAMNKRAAQLAQRWFRPNRNEAMARMMNTTNRILAMPAATGGNATEAEQRGKRARSRRKRRRSATCGSPATGKGASEAVAPRGRSNPDGHERARG